MVLTCPQIQQATAVGASAAPELTCVFVRLAAEACAAVSTGGARER